uniref:4'-phosphopantetheinyl transferase n=1 Tax=Candidatus Kentrum sp. DK TaxID=2126562 RepID=A0A450TEL2_9GAMM|nr:MAG: 4'-phosphopantetheinyl transferase [Candidatus Kentron sp. DK]
MMPSPVLWHPGPGDPVPPGAGIHIWRVRLDRPSGEVERLRAFLAEEERLRAERFYFPEHRRHFIVARGVLRVLLGRYLRQPPGKIRFAYNRYGKPFPDPDDGFRFNLSHSGGMALYAFARRGEIGIDMEWMGRGVGEMEQIAERFFAPREARTLLGLPAPERKAGFFRCWTRKEAYVKARGRGLSIPLDRFEVALAPEEEPRLLVNHDDPGDADRWSMHSFVPEKDYIAALVVEGADHGITYYDFVPEKPPVSR